MISLVLAISCSISKPLVVVHGTGGCGCCAAGAAGRDVFVCGGAPFAWLCPTCFQPLREPPLRDAMLAASLTLCGTSS